MLGLVFGSFTFVIWVALSGELGRVLKGAVQAPAPAGETADSTLRWGLALAATAAVMFAPVGWRHARSAGNWLIATALLAISLGAGWLAPDPATWAAVALPVVVASAATSH